MMDLQSLGQVVLITAIIAGLIGFYIRPVFVWGKTIVLRALIRPRYQKRIMRVSLGKIERVAEFYQKQGTQKQGSQEQEPQKSDQKKSNTQNKTVEKKSAPSQENQPK
ncbi:MAG: hypothetical protein ACRC5U_06485 [Plesiomonas sp.]